MFSSVFRRTLWEHRRSAIIWAISMAAFGLFMAYFYPSVAVDDTYAQLVENFEDSAVTALFGDFGELSTASGFIGAELYSFMLPIVAITIAVGIGASTLAKEEESGTLELLLAGPLSRRRILFEKALALAVNVCSMAAATGLGLVLGTVLVEEFNLSFSSILWVNVAVSLLGIVMGYFALLVTAHGLSRGVALGATIGGYIIMYFANTLPNLVATLEPVRPFSVMRYFDYQAILNGNTNWLHMLVLLSASVVLYALAQWRFSRRDTGV